MPIRQAVFFIQVVFLIGCTSQNILGHWQGSFPSDGANIELIFEENGQNLLHISHEGEGFASSFEYIQKQGYFLAYALDKNGKRDNEPPIKFTYAPESGTITVITEEETTTLYEKKH